MKDTKRETKLVPKFFDESITLCEDNLEFETICNKLPSYDKYYIWHGTHKDLRYKIEYLWKIFKGNANKHFSSEYRLEGKYLSRLWEMLVGVSLAQNNIQIKPNPKDRFPDFYITINNKNIIIECVSIQNTESDKDRNRVPNIEEIIDKNNALDVPNQELSLRVTTALRSKTDCLNDNNRKYIEGKSYVIALDTSIFSHYQPRDGKLIHDILYGIGDYQLTYQRDGVNAYVIDQAYTKSENISKKIKAKNDKTQTKCTTNTFKKKMKIDTAFEKTLINIGHFTKSEYDYVSGVIILNTGIHNINTDSISDSFIFIKNNRAKYPIDSELIFIPKYIEPIYQFF